MAKIVGVHVIDKFQKKNLPGNVTTNGTVSALGFNNLVIGKRYEVFFQAQITSADGAFQAVHNGNVIANGRTRTNTNQTVSSKQEFIATATTLTFVFNISAGTLFGDGTDATSYVILKELSNSSTTTQWT